MRILNEWKFEPNEMSFECFGLNCKIKKMETQHYVAYVFLPRNNPYFGKDESILNPKLQPKDEITYTDFQGDFWAVGIDFAHFNDYVPEIDGNNAPEEFKGIYEFFGEKEPTSQDYKNLDYVIDRIEKLAEILTVLN